MVFIVGTTSQGQSGQHTDLKNLLTPDYGLLTESDFRRDRQDHEFKPYDPNNLSGDRFWQCFSLKDIRLNVRKLKGSGDFCDFQFVAHRDKQTHQYISRRAQENEDCDKFQKSWQKLTKAEKYVCLNGESGEHHWLIDKISGQKVLVNLWTYIKFKTHKGCFAYFSDDCELYNN